MTSSFSASVEAVELAVAKEEMGRGDELRWARAGRSNKRESVEELELADWLTATFLYFCVSVASGGLGDTGDGRPDADLAVEDC